MGEEPSVKYTMLYIEELICITKLMIGVRIKGIPEPLLLEYKMVYGNTMIRSGVKIWINTNYLENLAQFDHFRFKENQTYEYK